MALLNRVEPKDRGEFSGRTTALALGVGGEAGFGGILARGAVIVALCIGGDACGGRPFSCGAALALGTFELNSALPLPGAALYTLERAAAADATAPRAAAYGGGDGYTIST